MRPTSSCARSSGRSGVTAARRGGSRTAPARRASLRRVPVRRGGSGSALALARPAAASARCPSSRVTLLALPLLLADLRLSDRYAPGGRPEPRQRHLRRHGNAARARRRGGRNAASCLRVFVALAAIGTFALARSRPPVAAFASLTVAVPPAVLALASAAGVASDRLAPPASHLHAPTLDRARRGRSDPARSSCFQRRRTRAPSPRSWSPPHLRQAPSPSRARFRRERSEPSQRRPRGSRRQLGPGDVLYPYSPVFLAALPSREGSAGVLARAGGARPSRQAHGRDQSGLHLDPAARTGRRSRLRASGNPLPRVSVVAHPRVTRPVRERDGRAAVSCGAAAKASSPLVTEPDAHAYLEQIDGTACAALVRARLRLLAGRDLDGRRVAPQIFEAVVGT